MEHPHVFGLAASEAAPERCSASDVLGIPRAQTLMGTHHVQVPWDAGAVRVGPGHLRIRRIRRIGSGARFQRSDRGIAPVS